MAIISGSPLMCPQCQAKMQAITSRFDGMFFFITGLVFGVDVFMIDPN